MTRAIRRQFSVLLGLTGNKNQSLKYRRIHITKAQNESSAHIILKIIGFVWFFEHDPVIEPKIDWRYRPDVVVFCPNGPEQQEIESTFEIGIKEWIECKTTRPKKIRKILQNFSCNFSLFHRESAIYGYLRALIKVLRTNDLHRVNLYGVSGDFDLGMEFLKSNHRVIVSKQKNSLVFQTKNSSDSLNYKITELKLSHEIM